MDAVSLAESPDPLTSTARIRRRVGAFEAPLHPERAYTPSAAMDRRGAAMADWFGSLDFREPVVEVWNGLRALSPRIAGSIAVLALGYALARLASTVGERLLV